MSPQRSQSGGPLIALAAVVLLPALALFGLWRYADGKGGGEEGESLPTTVPGAAAPPAPPPPLSTPLISFRRIPGLIARDLNDDAFAQQVASFAATLDSTSCLVVRLDGAEVGSHNPDLPVIPASNQKLLIAAAALHVLGPDHTFTTQAQAAGLSAGVVPGDLYLVGGGDPLLTTNDYPAENINGYAVLNATPLDTLADNIAAAGVTQIQGNLVADASRYDDEFFRPDWTDEERVLEAGPLDSLLVNDARFLTDDWQVANTPSAGAGEELARLLEERGISIGGEVVDGTAPADTPVVASIASAALPAVIAEMESTSDNNTAELLLKEIGFVRSGQGTTEAGAAAALVALQELGIDTTGMVISDGSGISNDNRVTCAALSQILSQHEPDDEFSAGLPVAGETGTLSEAFVDSPVAGRLVAKTGTLENAPYNQDPPSVKALSGYLPVEGGGTIEFSFILNSAGLLADQSVYRPIWDAFANVLAGYPSGPSAADLGPG